MPADPLSGRYVLRCTSTVWPSKAAASAVLTPREWSQNAGECRTRVQRLVETGPATVKLANPPGAHDDIVTAVGMVVADLAERPDVSGGGITVPGNPPDPAHGTRHPKRPPRPGPDRPTASRRTHRPTPPRRGHCSSPAAPTTPTDSDDRATQPAGPIDRPPRDSRSPGGVTRPHPRTGEPSRQRQPDALARRTGCLDTRRDRRNHRPSRRGVPSVPRPGGMRPLRRHRARNLPRLGRGQSGHKLTGPLPRGGADFSPAGNSSGEGGRGGRRHLGRPRCKRRFRIHRPHRRASRG